VIHFAVLSFPHLKRKREAPTPSGI